MSEADIRRHIGLRSQMFRFGGNHSEYDVTRKLEFLISVIYSCLVRKGDIVVDIGAHVGYHARILSDLVGWRGVVLAIEPNEELVPPFWKYVGHRRNVQLIHKVLSNVETDAFFYRVSGRKSSRSSIHLWDTAIPPNEYRKEPVRTATLDAIFPFRELRFIKIDAEGADLDCLGGSQEVLTRFRPYIVLEWNKTSYQVHGHRASDLRNFAVGLDYRVFNTFGDDLTDSRLYEAYSEKFGDVFLVPSELREQFLKDTRDAVDGTLASYESEIAEVGG